MRDFKIEVTPEQSEVIQKLLFLTGYSWCSNDTNVQFIEKPFLFFHYYIGEQKLFFTECVFTYEASSYDEITFDEFINEIEIELNEKFQNKSYTITF